VQPVAELETFGTQGLDFRCVLAGTYILRYASSWHDTDISHNLIRTRKCAHWDNKANPPHLPMLPSAAQQFQLEVAFSPVSPIHRGVDGHPGNAEDCPGDDLGVRGRGCHHHGRADAP